MKKIGLASLLFLLLVACAPRAVPAPEPVFFAADKNAIFAAVVQAIGTSPGLDNSSGWVITQSDSEGGFVSASTTVTRRGLFGGSSREETVSVVVSQTGTNRTQVVIQKSAGADALATRIKETLELNFGLN